MADGLSAVATNALPRAMATGSWLGMRTPRARAPAGKASTAAVFNAHGNERPFVATFVASFVDRCTLRLRLRQRGVRILLKYLSRIAPLNRRPEMSNEQ